MRKIRIALVSLDWIRSKDPLTNLGHASILSTLQKYNSHQVTFLNNHRYSVKNCLDVDGFSENVVKNLVVDEPDLVAFGVYIWNELHTQLILKKFRKRMKQVDHVSIGFAGKGSGEGKIMIDYLRKPLILLGGPQISYAPINTLENYYPDADLFIRGYAEKAFSQVVETLSTPNTLEEVSMRSSQYPITHQNCFLRSISTSLNTSMVSNAPTALLHKIKGLHQRGHPDLGLQAAVDMTSLPSPFLPIEPLENNSNSQSNSVNSPVIPLNNRSFIRWETQRGCPFKCTFCQHRDSYTDRQPLSTPRTLSEIQAITASSVNDIAVLDPTFNSGPNYLSTLDNLIKYKYKGKLSLQTRFEMIKPQFIEKCSVLVNEINTNIQLEFGVQSIIKQESLIIQRMNNLKSVKENSLLLNKHNIKFEISLIYGLPFQTIESFKESIKFVKELGAERVVAWPLMLLRGTELEKRKDELGLREEVLSSVNLDSELPKERISEGIPHVVESPSFTKDDWKEMMRIAHELT
ncbi:4534_t:CDS:2 [Funneliformis mosseae]|uniref:4534_t:CDS:1 n=1 Tax=Funneliformis mosseae TaxID=27381 RepID=A0A9N9EVX8_FUNMO|nr:4534_t:CDS:2 [Funneliformis mosseae]